MKLTLITATYNSENTILDCLRSVALQDYGQIEHLIIDGKSNDNTLSIIENFKFNKTENRVISEKDKGIYDALNKGIAMASGDIVGFVHSDDFLSTPHILSRIVKSFDENTAGVYGDLDYVDSMDSKRTIRAWKSTNFSSRLLAKGWMPPHPTLFLKKEVYKKHGNFDLDFKIAADYDFMLRIFSDNSLQFCYLPEVITKMRVGGVSNRNLRNLIKKSTEDYRALKNNNIAFPLKALVQKNISKIPQFF